MEQSDNLIARAAERSAALFCAVHDGRVATQGQAVWREAGGVHRLV